ncbi:MAG: hypothetical protein LBC87_06530 [Fibromonadaceae bacterium]|nr:hypothetical protein [Fibromonadaceae bacterium]
MRNSPSKLALSAALAFAITFTFSCSSPDDDNGGGGSSSGGNVPSVIVGSLSYQGKTYKTVKIGTQTWMAENLNYEVSGSLCYENDPAYCNEYGRLYDWETAKTVCPSGWHLPGKFDWDKLVNYVESNSCSAYELGCVDEHLKATSGWKNGDNGTDTYSFAALPSGFYSYSGDNFLGIGNSGGWWIATENEIFAVSFVFYSRSDFFSVRCIQN